MSTSPISGSPHDNPPQLPAVSSQNAVLSSEQCQKIDEQREQIFRIICEKTSLLHRSGSPMTIAQEVFEPALMQVNKIKDTLTRAILYLDIASYMARSESEGLAKKCMRNHADEINNMHGAICAYVNQLPPNREDPALWYEAYRPELPK